MVEDEELERELRRGLDVEDDWPVFVPARIFKKKGRRVTVHLMEGYAFVASGLDEVRYFRMENTKLVAQVLATRGARGIRALSTIPDSRVAELRRQLNAEVAADIVPGMRVLVTDGVYSKLEGIVLDTQDDHATVHFELRSLEVISRVPKVFLDTA
jgi:transcription antitermination factor NusG